MTGVPMVHGLGAAAVLFGLGVVGLLVRRNLIFMLMSVQIMLNAAGLAFVVAGSRWGAADGQVMFLFILTMAAAEVSVGLALVVRLHGARHTVDADAADEMRGGADGRADRVVVDAGVGVSTGVAAAGLSGLGRRRATDVAGGGVGRGRRVGAGLRADRRQAAGGLHEHQSPGIRGDGGLRLECLRAAGGDRGDAVPRVEHRRVVHVGGGDGAAAGDAGSAKVGRAVGAGADVEWRGAGAGDGVAGAAGAGQFRGGVSGVGRRLSGGPPGDGGGDGRAGGGDGVCAVAA